MSDSPVFVGIDVAKAELVTALRPTAESFGVAPLARDSGTMRGKHMVWGGRAPVRAVLYMGTLVATRHIPAIRDLCSPGRRGKTQE
jgi:hypothetical protein